MPRRRSQQQVLSFPTRGVQPASGRAEPLIWIQRFVLWGDVAIPPLRDFPLQRGLNIICSPVEDDEEVVAAGHAAGKTLFCRLLRYCLGEATYADPEDTASIRELFPHGAVGIIVRVAGTAWAVRRPFSGAAGDSADRAESFDGLVPGEGAFDAFLAALGAAAFDRAHSGLVRDLVHDASPWLLMLAWLTRDQECRLDDLTHWRHQDSVSHSRTRVLSHGTRTRLLRVYASMYTSRSAELHKGVVARKHSTAVASEARRVAVERVLAARAELAHSLSIDEEMIWPSSRLQEDAPEVVDEHRERIQALVSARIVSVGRAAADPSYARLLEESAEAEAEAARLRDIAAQLRTDARNEAQRSALNTENASEAARKLRNARNPVCPYDDVRIDVEAVDFKCPLPRKEDVEAAAAALKEENAAREEARRDARAAGDRAADAKRAFVRQAAAARALRSKLEPLETEMARASAASESAWFARHQSRRFFERRAELESALAAEREAESLEVAARERRTDGLRDDHSTRLVYWFESLVRDVVAPEAEGTVVLDGKGLHPLILWRGKRRSVALNSLKIVLFDLAATLAAVEGTGCAPGFLLHDSPREGDLDAPTYARLFHAVEALAPDAASAPFQYIVTTTTKPPREIAKARVRLELGAGHERRRLFKVDFG